VRAGRYAEAEALLLQMASEAPTSALGVAGRVFGLRRSGSAAHRDPGSVAGRTARTSAERGTAGSATAPRSPIATAPGVHVSVRLPNGALVPVSLGAPATGRGLNPAGAEPPLPAIRVVLPAGAEHSAAAALPKLVEAVSARQLRAAVGTSSTDMGRAFALGLPETVVSSLRALSERAALSDAGAFASYRALLGTSPELDMLGLEASTSPPWDRLDGDVAGLGTTRRSGAAVAPPGRTGIVPVEELRTLAMRATSTPAAGSASAPRLGTGSSAAAAAERLAWAVTGTNAGGLTLELVDRSSTPAAATLAGGSLVRLPDGRLVPAATARGGSAAPGAAATLLTPTARAARAGLAFSDERLSALGFTQAADRARSGQPTGGRDSLNLLLIQDLPSALPDGEEPAAATVDGMRALSRGLGSSAPRERGAMSALPGLAADLDVVSVLEQDERSPQGGGHAATTRGLASAARRAESFRPVGASSSAPQSATQLAREGRRGSRTGAGALALAGRDGGSVSTARAAAAARRKGTFGFDVSLGEELVRIGHDSPAQGGFRGRAGGESEPTTARGATRTASTAASSDPFGAWGGVSSLIRRLSDGGSASPAQRELASLIDSLPTSASVREGNGLTGTGFSRDLLVRLEAAIDTLSGGRSSKEMVSALRTGGGVSTVRVSDLGADSLMSLVSPVLGADPFTAPAASGPHGAAGGARARAAAPAPAVAQAASAAPAQALDGMDWSLVTPHAASTESGRSAPDLGRLARTALSSGGVKRTDLPLIAPATMAVAQHAQLSAREDAKPEAAAPANAGKPDAKKTAEAKVDLDKLAVEMANRISIRSRLELERRGIWRTS
jgi:hypothetical protein